MVKINAFKTAKELEKIKQNRLAFAKQLYSSKPFVTKTYLASRHAFPIKFLDEHWNEITGQ